MADIITTLHPEGMPEDDLYPNIKKENLPSTFQPVADFALSEYEKTLNLFNIYGLNENITSASDDEFIIGLYSNNRLLVYPFKENTAYTFSCDYITEVTTSSLRLYFYYSDGTSDIALQDIYSAVSGTRYSSVVTSDPNKTLVSIGITYGDSYGGGSLTVFDPMLVEGSVAKPFVSYNGKIIHTVDVEGDKLWENGNPNSDFGANVLNISVSSDYKIIVIEVEIYKGNGFQSQRFEFRFKLGASGVITMNDDNRTNATPCSRVFAIANNQISFGECFKASGKNNSYLIPTAIYGIK